MKSKKEIQIELENLREEIQLIGERILELEEELKDK